MGTVIVDCGSGNLHSARKAFALTAKEAGAGDVSVSADPEDIAAADRLVLPGVGAFGSCSDRIHERDGMADAIEEAAVDRGVPFLGICVGMQLLASIGRERGISKGFGWIPGEVVEIAPKDPNLKVPHMGWNELGIDDRHPILTGVSDGDHVYFVHSFHFQPEDPGKRIARADYGGEITAAIASENLAGVQFHPEKSQRTGLRIIANFLAWAP